MINVFCSSWDNSAVFGPPSCAIMVLRGVRWSRVAFISPHTLPILSFNFGTLVRGVVVGVEGFSADRHLLALKFWDTRVVLPGFTRGHFLVHFFSHEMDPRCSQKEVGQPRGAR